MVVVVLMVIKRVKIIVRVMIKKINNNGGPMILVLKLMVELWEK
jgi:hypothetical protein